MKKLLKKNGFPTRYGYACGCGKAERSGDNSKSIFEDASHNVINVKWLDGPGTAKRAEKFYRGLRLC